MLNDLLKEVAAHVAGKPAEEMVPLIHSKKHVNEFNIANKMELTINQTRNLLYKLSSHNLVSSTREKDEKKGWYTYFWKIEVLKSLNFLKQILQTRIDRIERQVSNRENNNFYTCERCGIELNEEQALMYDFICNECGSVLTLKDNTKVLRALRKNLTKFKNKMAEVDEEIEKEQNKIEKEKEKLMPKKKTTKKATTKKSTTKKSATKKASKKKSTTKKSAKKKTTKKAAKKSTTKKTASKKKTAKKTTKKATTKKSTAKKTAKKATTKKSTAKKTIKKAAKKSTAKKATTKKTPSKKKTTKKTKK